MKIQAEKMSELLTLEEQNQMLENLMLMEALVIAHQEYLKAIGKLDEGKRFVRKFMNDLTNDDFKKELRKYGVQSGSKSKNKFDA